MLSKVTRLFNRYCDHHFAVYAPGFPIFDASGRKLGQVERVCFGRNSARLEGWSISEQLAFGSAGRQNWQKPDILRPDVNAVMGLAPARRTGFNLSWFGDTRGLFLSLTSGKTTLQIMCPDAGRLRRVKAKIHIRIGFAKALLRAAPALLRAVVFANASNRLRAKRALGLEENHASHILDARIFEQIKPVKSTSKITLIMPVFNAIDVLQIALKRITQNTELPWRLILVEDCSTDAQVRPMLRHWVAENRAAGCAIELIENESNLGFIGSVNKAFSKALQYRDHVVLINSDALVPKDWALRLLTPILKNALVASVTPMSNNAEIFTAPVTCRASEMEEGAAVRVDQILGAQISPNAYRAAPTGVGFCMAINVNFLRKLPKFDPVFGKGYGEEVDWCQKTTALGGTHMCQPNLFVEHRGGASFGNATKRASIAKNNLIVSNRYPNFDRSVQRFIADDPLRTPRLLAAIAQLSASEARTTIFIAHSLGGGADLYLKEKIAEMISAGQGVIVLRVGGVLRWRLEVHTAQGALHGESEDARLVHRMLLPLKAREIVYSCAVGDPDPMGLIEEIHRLASGEDATLKFLVHDYFAISPSYCLLNYNNVYQGVPEGIPMDQRHGFRRKNGKFTTNAEWRTAWQSVLDASEQIVCFSNNSADLIRLAYPNLQAHIDVTPHSVGPVKHVRAGRSLGKPTIGILGDIGIQKGAQVLSDLSGQLASSEIKNIVIVGHVDPQFPLGPRCIETGSYSRREIAALAERHSIQAWFIPSIWPETFSYTTHEALGTGLPVLAFDIGAQGDAVACASNGHAVPFELRDHPQKLLSHIEEVLAHGATRRRSYSSAQSGGNRGFAA